MGGKQGMRCTGCRHAASCALQRARATPAAGAARRGAAGARRLERAGGAAVACGCLRCRIGLMLACQPASQENALGVSLYHHVATRAQQRT